MNNDAEKELERFTEEAKKQGARALILFGSRATGRFTDRSDVDVCLISEALPTNQFKRRYPSPSGYLRLSVFGFFHAEYLTMLRSGNPFVLDITHFGKPLHDDGFLREARDAFDEAVERYGLTRTARGWDWNTDLVPS